MLYEFLDNKNRVLKLKITNMDDLWILYTLLRPGDIAVMRTLREVKSGERPGEKSRRVPMSLKIVVEKIDFQPFTKRLRIGGVVVEGPDKYGIQGSHHTFSLEPGREIILEREEGWGSFVKRMLDDGLEDRGCVLIVAIDYDEIAVGVYRIQGVQKVLEEELKLPGKQDENRDRIISRMLEEESKVIANIVFRTNCSSIVVGGPGFLKDYLAKSLKNRVRGKRVVKESASMGGWTGVMEIIRRGEPLRILGEDKLLLVQKLVNEALVRMNEKPDMVGVGVDECRVGAEASAVEEVLVLDEKIASEKTDERKEIELLLEKISASKGKVHIVPFNSPAGEILYGLGGIVCLYRYPVVKYTREATSL